MKKYEKKTLKRLAILGILIGATGCAGGLKITRPSDSTELKYLKNDLTDEQSPIDFDTAQRELRRTKKELFGLSGYVYIESTLRTYPLIDAENHRAVKALAYKEKWDEARIKSVLKVGSTEAKHEIRTSTCFSLFVESSSAEAANIAYWHGKVVQDDSKLDLTFTPFDGIVETTRTTHVSGYGGYYSGHTTEDKEYRLYSKACTKKPIDTTRQFKVIYEPRFDEGIDVMELEWKPKAVVDGAKE